MKTSNSETTHKKVSETNTTLASTALVAPISLESNIYLQGATCHKCKNRFPCPTILQDYEIQCPECGNPVTNITSIKEF